MVTIRRHPVPTDSYDPKRPLNDLLVAQLEHFKHVAKNLPSDLRNTVPAEPSLEDGVLTLRIDLRPPQPAAGD